MPLNRIILFPFLRSRKFDPEEAYDVLIKYFTLKRTNSDVLTNLTPSNSAHIIDCGITTFLPSTDKHGRGVLYTRLGKWKPSEFPMMQLLRVNLMSLEEVIRNEEVQVKGMVFILNAENVGWSHLRHIDRHYFKTMAAIQKDSFPIRVEAAHFVYISAAFKYINSFLDSLMKRINTEKYFHGSSLESLQEHFDVSSLPEELGGSLGSEERLADAWKQHLYSNEEYFKQMMEYKIEL